MVEQEERKAKQKRMVQRIKVFYGRLLVYKRKTERKRTERKGKNSMKFSSLAQQFINNERK